jgi:hypothetical protein
MVQQTFAGLRNTFAGRKYFLKLLARRCQAPMTVEQ